MRGFCIRFTRLARICTYAAADGITGITKRIDKEEFILGMTHNQLKLIRALAENRIQEAKKYAIACCAEDTTKKNEQQVLRYRTILENRGPDFIELPPNLKGLLRTEDVSGFREGRYYLGKKEAEVFRNIEQTNKVSMRLLELGIPYLNSTLLYGEPGTGKTMFGRYVAYKLNLPFAYLNFSFLIDSYLGNTSKNIQRVFDYCKGKPCVLMLDEVDCIGLQRGSGSDGPGGELARVTISLMQELDTLTNEQIVIAATNREDRLDKALKRRFFQKVEITRFGEEERMVMALKFLDDVGVRYDVSEIESYVKETRTQAEIIKFATTLVINNIAGGLSDE